MTGKTHTAVGCAAAVGTLTLLVKEPTLVDIGLTLLTATTAATIPDIDVGASKRTYKIVVISMFVCLATILAGLAFFNRSIRSVPLEVLGILGYGCFIIFSAQQPHRGFTHSFLALGISTVCMYVLVYRLPFKVVITLAYFFSYLSHLIIDLPNKKGSQYLYPLPKRYCLGLCRANGVANRLIGICGEVATILILVLEVAG